MVGMYFDHVTSVFNVTVEVSYVCIFHLNVRFMSTPQIFQVYIYLDEF